MNTAEAMALLAKQRAKVGVKPPPARATTPRTNEEAPGAPTTLPACVLCVPVRTVNPMNGSHGKWQAKAGRRKAERAAMARALLGVTLPPLPVVVTLTRFGRGVLDDDALPASNKSLRDQIADTYGVDDGAKSPIKFLYDQQRAREYSVRVEIVPR